MNPYSEIIRAGADDWLFMILVLFGVAAQAIDAARKKKELQQRAAEKKDRPPQPSAAPLSEEKTAPDLDIFLKMLGVEREKEASPPRSADSPAGAARTETEPDVPATAQNRAPEIPLKPVPPLQMKPRKTPLPEKESIQKNRSLAMQGIRMPLLPSVPSLSETAGHGAMRINLQNRSELRRAVIHQEILGKPRAMNPF